MKFMTLWTSFSALAAALIASQAPVGILHAEAAHPFFSVEGDGRGAENVLKEYTEKEFLEFVPRQAPRGGQTCPAAGKSAPRLAKWEWNPHNPNEIRCGTFVYPDAKYPPKMAHVEVLSGKTVEVPYFDTPKGPCFVQAEIDNAKRIQLWRSLGLLTAGYASKHDERFARRIAVALDALASSLPDYFMTAARGTPRLVGPAEAAQLKWNVGRASDHNGLAHEWSIVEVRAFDAIWNSQALRALSAERGYDVRAHIAKDYFANEGDFITQRVPIETATGTNLSGPFQVLAETAVLLGRPDYIEWLNRYLEATVTLNFLRDGMYPESFGYHKEYAEANLEVAEIVSRYFTIYPADTDALRTAKAASAERLRQLQRSAQVHLSVALPNGDAAPFDDTLFGSAPLRTTTRSVLLPAYGHLVLGSGEGSTQTQLNLHFNDSCNHTHKSVLGLSLFAFGQELLGNNRYAQAAAGRGFLNSTMAHNTVTIDRTSQERSRIQLEGNLGHLFTGGDLKTFEPGLGGVALAEIDGQRAYRNVPERRYKRLAVLNTADPAHPYMLDIFRVGGGRIHDYFLHGAIKFDETAQASFPLTKIAKQYPLLEEGEEWIEPKENSSNTNWYGVFREMSAGRSPGNWNASFLDASGKTGTRVHVADDGDSQVFLGKSPVVIRENPKDRADQIFNFWRPTLLIRRTAHEGQPLQSLFVSVIEPLHGVAGITKVERLPLKQPSLESAALRITFANGRQDICLVNLSDAAQTISTADDVFVMQGRFGLASKDKTALKSWLIAGRGFRYGNQTITLPAAAHTGRINAVMRRKNGAAADAFVTDAALPVGTALHGRWLSLTFGTYKVVPEKRGDYPLGVQEQSGISQMFQIDHIEQRDGKTWIHLTEDPAFTIQGDKAVETLRPQRTFEGQCRFEIALSRYAP